MIQAIPLQRARVPVLAVGALGLVALAAVAGPRINTSSVPAPAQPIVAEVVTLRANSVAPTDCRQTAYVTGDMAGDASPAAIYERLCPAP